MIKTSFLVTSNINHMVILRTPFITLITPYMVDHDDISFKYLHNNLFFPFLDQSHTRELNTIKQEYISLLQKSIMSDFLIGEFFARIQKSPMAPKKKGKEI